MQLGEVVARVVLIDCCLANCIHPAVVFHVQQWTGEGEGGYSHLLTCLPAVPDKKLERRDTLHLRLFQKDGVQMITYEHTSLL